MPKGAPQSSLRERRSVLFYPKREMLAAAKQVQLNIDHSAGVVPTPSAQTK